MCSSTKQVFNKSKKIVSYPIVNGYKICTRCMINLPINSFNYNNVRKLYIPSCKECTKNIWIQYYEKSKEKINTNRALKRATLEGKEKQKTRDSKRNKYMKEWHKLKRNDLSDSYIVSILIKNTGLKRSDISSEIIELKRTQLQLYRQLQNR